jgi:hypothetical protein
MDPMYRSPDDSAKVEYSFQAGTFNSAAGQVRHNCLMWQGEVGPSETARSLLAESLNGNIIVSNCSPPCQRQDTELAVLQIVLMGSPA